jgi:hypothetical protein
MRLAFRAEGDTEKAEYVAAETLWQPPILRSDAQRVDAALKMQQIGVPWAVVMEYLNYSPTQIARMEGERLMEQALQAPVTTQEAAAVAEPQDVTPDDA